MKKPKILVYDIETSPNIAYTWGKYDQTVIEFIKEVEILCFAYKWHDEPGKVQWVSREGDRDDADLCKILKGLWDKADIVVAHNGDMFDNKIAKARMLHHGLKPPKILCSVDTKKVAKTYFMFNGNGLDDLGRYLKLGRKTKLPLGFETWLGCLRDDSKCWKQMVDYNCQDVELLDRVFTKLVPWIESYPNVHRLLNPDSKDIGVCPTCQSTSIQSRGVSATKTAVRKRWSCNDCGKPFYTKWTK